MDVLARHGLSALALLCACSAKPAASPDEATAQGRALTRGEIATLITHVSGARQLSEQRPIKITQLPESAFAKKVQQLLLDEPSSNEADAEREAGWLLAFGLAPHGGGSEEVATASEVLQEQIAGFYDSDSDSVFVRHAALDSLEDEAKHLAVVAHEVHHALQYQHFDMKALRRTESDDQALARLALIEGDAMVAMGAYLGARYGMPIRRTLRNITDVVNDTMPADEMHSGEGHRDEKLDRALPILRERLLFPYADGMSFITDVYRAGGFSLVNAVYQRPPDTTAEVLHPEKYLAGFRAARIAALPDVGLTLLEGGSFGELQLRVMLAGCHDKTTATNAAAGWSGDRYAVHVANDGNVVLLWRTEWDSADDAAEFARAIAEPKCWRANDLRLDKTLAARDATALRRERTSVAFTRGLSPGRADETLAQLMVVAVERPGPHAVEPVTLPPREPLPKPQPGRVKTGVYKSKWLGLTGRVPSGMSYRVAKDGVELHIERTGAPVVGRMLVSDRITTDELNDKAFTEMAKAFAHALGAASASQVSSSKWRSPLGESIERTFTLPGTWIQLRAVLVPICAGTGSLVFIQAYGDAHARAVLDGWLSSFRWLTDRNLPVCGLLDPK